MRCRPACATAILSAVLSLFFCIPTTGKEVDYLTEVKPLLMARCVACHGPLKQSGGLRLDTAALAMKGGESGTAVVAGRESESVILQRVSATDETERMPPEGEPLPAEQIKLLRRWIQEGAKAPPETPLADPKSHWAFQKVVRHPFPAEYTEDDSNPIDRFLNQRQQELGLHPLPEAGKAALLRRVYLDLVGVPPQREELLEFLADERPDAYERVVDRLLASPLYSQRWAKHWMDVWRYSDWYGSRDLNELRNSRRHIWRWRDWIIDSVAEDKGYDQMILEMLAADELLPGDENAGRATGFLGRNYYVFNRHVWLQDTIEHTAAGFLGLTFKCARCHDHKYDPVSHEDYYRLRAFFEPHHVRTDPIPGKSELLKGNLPAGAAPGALLKDGNDVVYDADLLTPTYLLVRGNEKNPATDHTLSPGLPAVLGKRELEIKSIELPLEAYYPDLREDQRQARLAAAQAVIEQAEAGLKKITVQSESTRLKLKERSEANSGNEPATLASFLHDEFDQWRPDIWKVYSGEWKVADGRLVLGTAGRFLTIATAEEHPRDFHATLKYRTTGGSVGSIGLFFDMVELKDAQAVYTHVNANSSGVQAFHRQNGSETYPAAGIVNTPLKLGEEITLEIKVQGQELKIWLNGELKLAYTMPLPRQRGTFGLWMHEGLGSFDSVTLRPFEATVGELTVTLQQQEAELQIATHAIRIAQAEYRSLESRIAAELARFAKVMPEDQQQELARAASRAERELSLQRAEADAFTARREHESAQLSAKAGDVDSQKNLAAAEAKLNTSQAAVEMAKANLAKEDTTYQPLGPVYPTTSSGRRLALARWIVARDNPLTARVAVNHIWKRHFGTGIVPSLANFGLNGKPPTHPELLDWLAAEFMENGWSQRHLHRLILTSQAYRRSSGDASHQEAIIENNAIDGENKTYWRSNIHRMESEVVRDSLLSLTESLDSSTGGPELDPAKADVSPRRSLYFRLTPDDQATMLQLFDGVAPAECYERTESVVPQQALALANSPVAVRQSRLLARKLSQEHGNAQAFVRAAFEQILTRSPDEAELQQCQMFLERQAATLAAPERLKRKAIGAPATIAAASDPEQRARENLVQVLINHNDFVTVR